MGNTQQNQTLDSFIDQDQQLILFTQEGFDSLKACFWQRNNY